MKWSIQELFRINKLAHNVRKMSFKTRVKTYPKRAAARIYSFFHWLFTGVHPYASLFTYDILIYELQVRLIEYYILIQTAPTISIASIFINKDNIDDVGPEDVAQGKTKLINILSQMIALTELLTVEVNADNDTVDQELARIELFDLLQKYSHYFYQ